MNPGPVIKAFDEKKIVGMKTTFIAHGAPGANGFEVIPPLWGRYSARSGEITARVDTGHLGVMFGSSHSGKLGEMVYVAGAAVTDTNKIPEGMVTMTVPAGKYAVFTHHGPISNLNGTLQYIYGTWLPKVRDTVRDAPHLEIYDDRFNADRADSEFEICVPVV